MSVVAAGARALSTAAAATASSSPPLPYQSPPVINTYRILARLIQKLPPKQRRGALSQLRDSYRKNASVPVEDVPSLVEEAGEKIAYLRIVTPKNRTRRENDSFGGSGRWVYKDGHAEKEGVGTYRDVNGRVVSNWTGSNLDPCSVKRHNAGLKRAGFVNNLHAKGLF